MSRVLAIAALRFTLMLRKIRGPSGRWIVAATVLLGLLGLAIALGAAVAFGALIHVFASDADPDRIHIGLSIVFWTTGFVGVILPLLRGAMDQGFDTAPFVVFPIPRVRLYGITLVASAFAVDHVLYYPTIVAVAATGVLAPGIDPFLGLALLVLLPLTFVVWSHLLALVLTSVMRARRVREFVAIAVLLLVISASVTPALLDEGEGGVDINVPELKNFLGSVSRVTAALPPAIAARGLTALHSADDRATAALDAMWLVLWNAFGVIAGYWIFDRYHLAERGVKLRQSRPASGRLRALQRLLTFDAGPLAALPPEVRAVASKDLRYLLRSVVGRFVLLMGPLFVFVVVFLIGRALKEPVLGLEPDRLLLFGMMLYTAMFSNNFLNNAFAWDGEGVKSYFLSPISLERVLVGKNIAVWLFNVILVTLVLTTWSIVMGLPSFVTLLTALLLYSAALVCFTGCGNILSVMFPVPRDMSTTRNQPAQIAILISLGVLLATALVLGPFVSIPALLGWTIAQPVLLLLVLGGMVGLYVLTLRHAARLFANRRERILDALKQVR